MKTKAEILKELDVIDSQKAILTEELRRICDIEEKDVERKIKLCNQMKGKFEPDELRFAAYARCECGAGMAYPEKIGMHGAWYCSDILLGLAIRNGDPGFKIHSGLKPFAFYEIISEGQPSAEGATTRP